MKITLDTCFKRLQISKSRGSPYFVADIELIGEADIPPLSKIEVLGFDCYVINVRKRPTTTEIIVASQGWFLTHMKSSRTLLFTSINDGNAFALQYSTMNLEPDTLLIYRTNTSPWADNTDGHFYVSEILQTISNYLFYFNNITGQLNVYTNYNYKVKDFQLQKGSDIISAIKNIYSFNENDIVIFADKSVLYVNVFPILNSILNIVPCVLAVISTAELETASVIGIGLQGRTGIWKEEEKNLRNEKVVYLTGIPEHQHIELHKKLLLYKYKHTWKKTQVTQEGENIYLSDEPDETPTDIFMDYIALPEDIVSTSRRKYALEYDGSILPEHSIFDTSWIEDYAITSFSYDIDFSNNEYPIIDILENIVKEMTSIIISREHLTVYEDTVNIYVDEVEGIGDSFKEVYTELPVVRSIRAVQPENSFTYFIKRRSGIQRIVKGSIIDNYYTKIGNLLLREQTIRRDFSTCLEIPNYDTNFLFNPWNLATVTRFVDLVEPTQRDVEDIVVTAVLMNIRSALDIYILMLLPYRPNLIGYIVSGKLEIMKEHPLIKAIVEHNFLQNTAVDDLIRRIARVLYGFVTIAENAEDPLTLVIYAEEGTNGWNIENFETLVSNHILYRYIIYPRLRAFLDSLDTNIRLRLIQKSITRFSLISRGKAIKIEETVSYNYDKRKRYDTSQEIIESDRIFIQLKPRTIGEIKTGNIDSTYITSFVKIPTNNKAELDNTLFMYRAYQEATSLKSYSLLYTKQQFSSSTMEALLKLLCTTALEFAMLIDNSTGLIQINYSANEINTY